MRSRPAEASEFSFAVTDDAVLGGRLKLMQPERGHRVGHDAILLAAAASQAKHAIDLGAGVGTAGLALLARGAAGRVTLIEIDEELAALARANAERNGYGDRVEVVCADVADIGHGDGADLVLMNPPFNDPARTQSSPDPKRRRAHVGNDADLTVWIGAAHRQLRHDGKLVLIHRPEARPAILAAFEDRFGATEEIPILPKPGGAAIRLIVRAAKGKRAQLVIRAGFVLADKNGRPTPEAEAVLRHAHPLDPA